jgi:hypothetical protein
MNRGDIVYLATDPRRATGTVCGQLEDGRVVVAWHIGRTWIYEPGDLVDTRSNTLAIQEVVDPVGIIVIPALHAEVARYLETVDLFREEGCDPCPIQPLGLPAVPAWDGEPHEVEWPA